jgi:hypothetical protein
MSLKTKESVYKFKLRLKLKKEALQKREKQATVRPQNPPSKQF